MKTAKELFDELNSWDENRRIEAEICIGCW